jgi:hypothetical protein
MTLRLPYTDEHHGFAPLMLAMVEAHRAKITEIPISDNPTWSRRINDLTKALS